MIPRERCDYSAIVDRPPLKLPGNARIVFWTIVNYEVWDISRADGAAGAAGADRPAAAARRAALELARIRHAGRRVALLRFVQEARHQADARRSMRASARIIRASRSRRKNAGWEFMGHAYEQMPIHKDDDQKAMIHRSMDVMEKFHRQAAGRLARARPDPDATRRRNCSPKPASNISATGSMTTSRRVIRTAKGPLVTLPYTVELNDIPMMMVQHHESDYLLKRAIDSSTGSMRRARDRAKIMSLAIHPYITGQPHRIKYLEAIYDYVNKFDGVLHWNGEQILDWYKSVNKVQFGP